MKQTVPQLVTMGYSHPSQKEKIHVSSAKIFDGEDISKKGLERKIKVRSIWKSEEAPGTADEVLGRPAS